MVWSPAADGTDGHRHDTAVMHAVDEITEGTELRRDRTQKGIGIVIVIGMCPW